MTTRIARWPRLAILALAFAAGAGAVGANAASGGAMTAGIFGASGAVTAPATVRSISGLTANTSGSPKTIHSVTLTVSGSNLGILTGQTTSVALFDSTGALIQSGAAVVATTNLVIGSTSATILVLIAGSPPKSAVASWSAVITAVETVGGGANPASYVLTAGSGGKPH